MSYCFVEQLHKKAIPVGRLCSVLGVSRSNRGALTALSNVAAVLLARVSVGGGAK